MLAVLVGSLDVHERMRVAEHELQQLAFDRHLAIFEVRGGERVMRSRRERRGESQQCGGKDDFPVRSHLAFPRGKSRIGCR